MGSVISPDIGTEKKTKVGRNRCTHTHTTHTHTHTYAFTCIQVHMWGDVHAHVCACVQRPEASIWCLPRSLPYSPPYILRQSLSIPKLTDWLV